MSASLPLLQNLAPTAPIVVSASPSAIYGGTAVTTPQMVTASATLSSGGTDPAGPFSCVLTWSLPLPKAAAIAAPATPSQALANSAIAASAVGTAALIMQRLQAIKTAPIAPWASGRLAEADLWTYGVRTTAPCTGVGATILAAINAASAAFALAGGDLSGLPVSAAIGTAWTLWRRSGGNGGPLQAPLVAILDTGVAGY
jgi:hypothetical protein